MSAAALFLESPPAIAYLLAVDATSYTPYWPAQDSMTLDPHRWLYQSFECGCLLVRDGELLRSAFAIEPDHLHDAGAGEVNFSDLGMQLSRASRALKV